jgi:drug/metabolite transporter (DMT)-like permease
MTCVITGTLVNGFFPVTVENMHAGWFVWAVMMGFMFIITFNLAGFTTQKLGVAVASVSYKLSLVIPFLFSLFLYHESSSWLKWLGVGIAITAVVLTCYPSTENKSGRHSWMLLILLPVLLFMMSGLMDTLIVYVKTIFFNSSGSNFNNPLITAFSTAACAGSLVLIYGYLSGRLVFSLKPVIAGILIGIPNYFSIWCLGKVIAVYKGNSSALIPVNNIGIVLLCSVTAWIFFKEKLSWINWTGILLAIAAIALLAYG